MARGLILLARHPRPLVPPRVCYGRTDVALAEPAEQGAAALLRACAPWTGLDPVARVVTSPAGRTARVARVVAREVGAPLHEDGRLLEMDFGAWEMRPWSAVPRHEIDAWAAAPLTFRPPGGETVAEMLQRVRRAWRGLSSSADTTLVVAHAGPIRCLKHVALGERLEDALAAGIPYGGIVAIPPG